MRAAILGFLAVLATTATIPMPASAQKPQIPNITQAPAAVSKFTGFTVGQTSCAAATQTVSMPVSAEFAYPLAAGSKTKVNAYIAVNGAATETFPLNVETQGGISKLRIVRTLSLPANRSEALLRLYIDGQPVGPVQTAPYSCYTVAAAPSAQPTARLEMPDLAIGPFAYAIASPTRPATICERRGADGITWENFWACGLAAPTLSLGSGILAHTGGDEPTGGPYGIPGQSAFFDANSPGRILRLDRTTAEYCPRESDAMVTVNFTIAIKSTRVPSPVAYVGEGHYQYIYSGPAPEYYPGGHYWNYSVTQPAPYERGFILFPSGYEWINFDRRLPCTRNGEFTYTIDAAGRLGESNESNNTITFRYSTVRP